MTSFGFLLKSYAPDRDFAGRLIESFHRHNTTGLPLYLLVPASDVDAFASLGGDSVTVMSEEPLATHFVTQRSFGLTEGYLNQQVVKLAFHELDLLDNYLCLDSDTVFLRDFTEADFIAPDGYPYTVLVEDRELLVEPHYYATQWVSRMEHLRRIAELIGYDDPVLRTCHAHQVFSARVLRSFVVDFLEPRGWSYRDALNEGPYEFSWYNFWLQATEVIPIHQREPLFKMFHHEGQHLEYILRGVTRDDMARAYVGMTIQSNFARHLGTTAITDSKPKALAPYLSYGELGSLISAKGRDTFTRRFGRKS